MPSSAVPRAQVPTLPPEASRGGKPCPEELGVSSKPCASATLVRSQRTLPDGQGQSLPLHPAARPALGPSWMEAVSKYCRGPRGPLLALRPLNSHQELQMGSLPATQPPPSPHCSPSFLRKLLSTRTTGPATQSLPQTPSAKDILPQGLCTHWSLFWNIPPPVTFMALLCLSLHKCHRIKGSPEPLIQKLQPPCLAFLHNPDLLGTH